MHMRLVWSLSCSTTLPTPSFVFSFEHSLIFCFITYFVPCSLKTLSHHVSTKKKVHCGFLSDCRRLFYKSAHTALAVKACLLGGNSNTKCSMTFVNIAVAISALAGGGGAKNGFAPRPDPKNGFAPRPEYGGVFDIFRGFLGV